MTAKVFQFKIPTPLRRVHDKEADAKKRDHLAREEEAHKRILARAKQLKW